MSGVLLDVREPWIWNQVLHGELIEGTEKETLPSVTLGLDIFLG